MHDLSAPGFGLARSLFVFTLQTATVSHKSCVCVQRLHQPSEYFTRPADHAVGSLMEEKHFAAPPAALHLFLACPVFRMCSKLWSRSLHSYCSCTHHPCRLATLASRSNLHQHRVDGGCQCSADSTTWCLRRLQFVSRALRRSKRSFKEPSPSGRRTTPTFTQADAASQNCTKNAKIHQHHPRSSNSTCPATAPQPATSETTRSPSAYSPPPSTADGTITTVCAQLTGLTAVCRLCTSPQRCRSHHHVARRLPHEKQLAYITTFQSAHLAHSP